MADEADVANIQVELNENRSIKYAQVLASKPIPKSDTCYWCSSKTVDGRRFCNRECSDNWEKWGMQ